MDTKMAARSTGDELVRQEASAESWDFERAIIVNLPIPKQGKLTWPISNGFFELINIPLKFSLRFSVTSGQRYTHIPL
jgi:hypothetical protein